MIQALQVPAIQRVPRSLRGIWKPLNQVARTQRARGCSICCLAGRSRILVVGGGTIGNGLDRLYACADDVEVIGLDLYGSDVTQLIADAHAIPLATGSIDAVIVQAVLEHVLDPIGGGRRDIIESLPTVGSCTPRRPSCSRSMPVPTTSRVSPPVAIDISSDGSTRSTPE